MVQTSYANISMWWWTFEGSFDSVVKKLFKLNELKNRRSELKVQRGWKIVSGTFSVKRIMVHISSEKKKGLQLDCFDGHLTMRVVHQHTKQQVSLIWSICNDADFFFALLERRKPLPRCKRETKGYNCFQEEWRMLRKIESVRWKFVHLLKSRVSQTNHFWKQTIRPFKAATKYEVAAQLARENKDSSTSLDLYQKAALCYQMHGASDKASDVFLKGAK